MYKRQDPHSLPHPVQFIGFLIARGEKLLRRLWPRREYLAGAVLTVGVTAISLLLPWGLLLLAGNWGFWPQVALETVFCYQILATKSLATESRRVYRPLVRGDLPGARKYLSWIVGRDTERLDEAHITRAVIETIAENTSDGVVAPLFYLAIGGAPLGFLYKAINTLAVSYTHLDVYKRQTGRRLPGHLYAECPWPRHADRTLGVL